MNKEALLNQYQFNLQYAIALVKDISEDEMTIIPVEGLENHAAFTLGHLISGSAVLLGYLGHTYPLSEKWESLFLRKGPGDSRMPDTEGQNYPTKKELLDALSNVHIKVEKCIQSIEEETFAQPFQWRFSLHMPTLWDVSVFLCINHEAMHLGQLAAWRRAMKYPSALATL